MPRLKNPDADAIEMCDAPPEPADARQALGAPYLTAAGGVSHDVPDQARRQIEECGRRAVENKLREMGYKVEQMPPDNPGFDISAERGAEKLYVEVKAHLGTVRTVELTARELMEYHECRCQENARCELWNVENLCADVAGSIRITRYWGIPSPAVEPRTLTVDLSRCVVMDAHD